MPRETIRINRYDGGIADDPSPKNLHEGELKSLVNLDISSDGKLTMLGKFTSNTALTSGLTSVAKRINPGYGLYTYSADFTSTGGSARTDYMAIAGKSTNNSRKVVEILESDGTTLLTVDLTTNDTTNFEPSFYYIDGALRVSDGNLNTTAPVSKWIGFVQNSHFEGTLPATTYSCWLATNQAISAPTAGAVGRMMNLICSAGADTNTLIASVASGPFDSTFDDASTELVGHIAIDTFNDSAVKITAVNSSVSLETENKLTWASRNYSIHPPTGEGVNLGIVPWDSSAYPDGQLTSGVYRFAISYVYDDSSQESRLFRMPGFATLSTTVGATPYTMELGVYATAPYAERLKKIRVYAGVETEARLIATGSSEGIQTWNHAFDIDMNKGVVVDSAAGNYQAWANTSAEAGSTNVTSDVYIRSNVIIYSLSADTYDSMSGNNSDDTQLSIRFKTVTINNRTAYYGGVSIDGRLKEDSIYKSLPNKFDVTGDSKRLDAATQDGESVVALESFADRVLEFKEKTLYIINTAQDIEFIEGQFDNMGIDKPYQVTRTEFGIMWFNDRGCYIYNGQGIRDLFLDPNDFSRRLIELNSWRTFKGSSAQIGYDEREKKAFIWSNSSGNSSSVSVRVYDFNTFGWSDLEGGIDNFTTQQRYTNMRTNEDGRAQVYSGGDGVDPDQEMMIWYPETTIHSSRVFMETKEFDMGMPGVKKNLYVVYVNHKNTGTGLSVSYRVNGTSTLNALVTSSAATVLPNSTSFVNTRLTPSDTSAGRNLSSVSIVLEANGDSTVPENLEIGDIEIIARRKTKR